jgi:hypothetical protein
LSRSRGIAGIGVSDIRKYGVPGNGSLVLLA